ncbi:hypothetical protein [Myroides odoratimimus]|uniref:hypothetical protein n=1 Tax=Myroides odoratimimus TaxID=76832 RepID=UPI002578F86A|nr:hypothetical protein [Myroides odoratimimus]MDM1500003.1 hypothetical protein [Myroides odoratimimus]
MLKLNKQVLFSFFIYLLSLAALLIGELVIAKSTNSLMISDWAFLKSSVMILGTVCLMGYDTLFVRDQTLIQRYFWRFITQTIIIACISAIVIKLLRQLNAYEAILVFLGIVFLALLSYISSSSRANVNLWQSQVAVNFWKIIFLLFIVSSITIGIVEGFVLSLFISLVISFFIKGYIPKKETFINQSPIPLSEANRMGKAFLITNLTLIMAVHGEQFFINMLGSSDISANIFRYTAVFTPIALSLNGFIGFYYAPKIRRLENFYLKDFKRFSFKILLFSILISIFSLVGGVWYMVIILDILLSDLNLGLIVILIIMCIIRGLYTATSIGLGIFGTENNLRKSSLLMVVCTAIYLLFIVLGLLFINDTYKVVFIAFCTMCNWLVRLMISNYYTFKELKVKENERK